MTLLNIFNLPLDLQVTNPTWIFFVVLTIILFAPMILGRLHIPHIVGMILAGVVIGEFGLNILQRDSSFELFGKVGLYYIMFLGGLDMDMDDFKKNRQKTIVFGLLTFIIPMALGIWSGMSLLHYSFVTATLLASMYASHTLIAYPIITRYGLSRKRSVSITIGGTAITVTFALLILAVISGMYKGSIDAMFWLMMGLKVSLVSCIIFFIFPSIIRWFFRTYEDNVMQYIFVLALVFLSCGMFEFAGMEGIIGAFITGLVLNRYIPRVSPLMNRIEFVGNALFIPYFLIGVGMIIDLRALLHGGEALKVAVVMTVVATVSKWLAAWLTQLIYKMKPVERDLIFGLSNAQAAATLAAVLIGHEIILPDGSRLLNSDVLNGTVVMILFTCIISSFATERAAAKMVKDDEDEADFKDAKKKEDENILIPVANPETIENLINMALTMKDKAKGTKYTALSVVSDTKETGSRDEVRGKQLLEKAANITASADTRLTMISRYDMNIASGILHTMKERNISELIIGLHRKSNIVDTFLGNISTTILKGTSKQLIIVKCLVPVNTINTIDVAVPPMAEYEVGFKKWIERLCRMSSQTGAKLFFYSNKNTLEKIDMVLKNRNATVRYEFRELSDWDDLLILTKYVKEEHMLVIISARNGTISHNATLEKLGTYLSKYFYNNSFIVLYPEQHAISEGTDMLIDSKLANVIAEQDNNEQLKEEKK